MSKKIMREDIMTNGKFDIQKVETLLNTGRGLGELPMRVAIYVIHNTPDDSKLKMVACDAVKESNWVMPIICTEFVDDCEVLSAKFFKMLADAINEECEAVAIIDTVGAMCGEQKYKIYYAQHLVDYFKACWV